MKLSDRSGIQIGFEGYAGMLQGPLAEVLKVGEHRV